MIAIMYQVYQLEGNVNDSLNLLCLGHERKVKYYNIYFIIRYMTSSFEIL